MRVISLDKDYVYELYQGNNEGEYSIDFPQLAMWFDYTKADGFYKRQITPEDKIAINEELLAKIETDINYTEEELERMTDCSVCIFNTKEELKEYEEESRKEGLFDDRKIFLIDWIKIFHSTIEENESIITGVKEDLNKRRLEYWKSKEMHKLNKEMHEARGVLLQYKIFTKREGKDYDILWDVLALTEKVELKDAIDVVRLNIEVVN